MAGILGDLFGLGGGTQAPTPGLLDAAGYMDPAQYDRMRQSQSMMGLWAGLLAGGGPSLTPRNFGSALGAGLTGAQQFGAQFDEASQHRAAAQKNLADIVAKKQGFQIAQDWINKGGEPSGTPGAAAAPGSGSSTPNFGVGLGGDYKGSGDPASLVKHFESGGNYNIGYGGTDLSNAPRDQYGFPQWAGKNNSHAAGAYQFQPGTWARYAAPLGIKDFSQESQDKVFAAAFAKEGWGPWAPYNPGLAAEVARRTSPGAAGSTTPVGAAIPDFTEGRAAAFGGPAPAPAILAAPGANPNAPVDRYGEPAPPGYELVPGGMRARQAAGPVNVRPLAGEAVPAEAAAAPSFGYGSAGDKISPAVLAAAAGGAPPVPSAMVAPAPPAPAPAPQGAVPPAAAAAPAPGATQPSGVPGPMTVTLPAPPAMPALPAIPAAQPLPAAPEVPGIPARPQIPGATPGAAVSPAVAARARQAQGVVLGLSMMGVHVPDFLQKEAGIEVAGRTAAAEAEAKQPIELQNKAFEASLTAAQKRWDALTDQQKETLAFQRGLTKDQMNAMYANVHEQYKSVLDLATAGPKAGAIAGAQQPFEMQKIFNKEWAQLLREWDVPQQIKQVGADGVERTITTTPRQMAGGLAPGATLSGTAAQGGPGAGAAPTAGPAPASNIVTGLGPGRSAELTGQGEALAKRYKAIQEEGAQANNDISTLRVMQAEGSNIAAAGILGPYVQHANRLINALTGEQADRVRSFEVVVKNGEELVRKATRDSDSQPAAIQLVMTRNSLPSPETSPAGFQRVVGDMIAVKEYQLYKRTMAERWLSDPANNNSLRGFENALPASSYAFIVNRMPQDQKIELFNKLRQGGETGRKEAGVLADQIQALRGGGF